LNLKFINTNAVKTTKDGLEKDGQNTKIMTVRYWRATKRRWKTWQEIKKRGSGKKEDRRLHKSTRHS
jgi:hypothetical protein